MPAKIIPSREIEFAAKVGFLTKALWKEFFAYGGCRWQNMLWRSFLKDGLFKEHGGLPNLYVLNREHREVKTRSPFVAKPPLLGQLAHDELVGRSYLLLRQTFPSCDIKTEAELKKAIPLQTKGARISDAQKHPDLVIAARESIAVEIELNQKSRGRYRAILRCYRMAGYKKVLYIVRAQSTMSAIESAANEVSFPRDTVALGFGSIGEWRGNPATTPIHFDHATLNLRELLQS